MGLTVYEAKIVGTAPLLMHNVRLVDPLNPHTKSIAKISAKREKTDEDLEELRWREWRGGLYESPEGEVAIPADVVLAVIVDGARRKKLDKVMQAAVVETAEFYPLVYKGPKLNGNFAKLYERKEFVDVRAARVKAARVMRCRPRFAEWSLPVSVLVNTEMVNVESVAEALRTAGDECGMLDSRPRYGRFKVEHVTDSK